MVRPSKTLVWRPDSDPRERRKHREKHETQPRSSNRLQSDSVRHERGSVHPKPVDGSQTAVSKPKSQTPKWTKEELEEQKRNEGYGRLYIQKQIKRQTPMVFEIYKHETLKGIIIHRFTYDLKLDVNGESIQIHKLNIKFFYKQPRENLVKEAILVNEDVRSQSLMPVPSKAERFNIDDNLLLDCHQNKKLVKVTTYEGEVMSGTIDWFSKFDIKLQFFNSGSVVVFRHSVYSFEVIE